MNIVAINSFVRRQTPQSPYTHWTFDDDNLILRTLEGLRGADYEPGYRDGVICVNVKPDGFYTGLVELAEGDRLTGEFKSRQKGETPRKSIQVVRENAHKVPCMAVQVILYSHEVLAEDGDAEFDTDYEIISVNGYPTEEIAPIDPNTLMHNHFKTDGGTATNMTPEQFEEALRKSFVYWNNKALLS